MRAGRFQAGVASGINLERRTLAIVGLGRIGGYIARYGHCARHAGDRLGART
jgi:lactate dehydrogenase-like 2-hydroxyacid dehydrogenase